MSLDTEPKRETCGFYTYLETVCFVLWGVEPSKRRSFPINIRGSRVLGIPVFVCFVHLTAHSSV